MRTDWTRPEIAALYHQPLLDLLLQAQSVHREFHPANQVQMCRLLSIKTGGCPEDCAYCPQSARYSTGVEREPLDVPFIEGDQRVRAAVAGAFLAIVHAVCSAPESRIKGPPLTALWLSP